MTETTITEKARVSIPLALYLTATGGIVIAAGGAMGTYFGMKGEIASISQTVGSIEKEIAKIADRVETGPSRREFDLVVERLRIVESKVRE